MFKVGFGIMFGLGILLTIFSIGMLFYMGILEILHRNFILAIMPIFGSIMIISFILMMVGLYFESNKE
jgi:hypothetical protein